MDSGGGMEWNGSGMEWNGFRMDEEWKNEPGFEWTEEWNGMEMEDHLGQAHGRNWNEWTELRMESYGSF